MKRINNISELQLERTRIRLELKKLEQEIKNDVTLIKHDLQPANLALKAVNGLFNRGESNGLTSIGVNLGIDLLLRNVLLRNAGWVSKLILPFFAKNAANNYVESHDINFIDIAKNLYSKWRGKNNHPIYDKTTAGTDY